MKAIMFVAAALMAVGISGCVSTSLTTYPDGRVEAKRSAFLYPFKVGSVTFDPATGMIQVSGYETDGGVDQVAEAAARGALFVLTSGISAGAGSGACQ